MRNKILFVNKWLAIIIAVIAIASCNRKFDAPPLNPDPEVDVTMTIMELKARYAAVGDYQRIEDNQIISGIVVADDRSGNFYKQIVIQDETGGIPIMLDANNVYTQYPVGRRVFIKLKGLMLGDYGGTIEVGVDTTRDGQYLDLDGIPQAMFDQYIIKGSFNNTITPKVVKPTDFTKKINDPLMSTLVQMSSMEFADGDTSKTYADATKTTSAVNFTIRNCTGQSMLLRNSSYSRFAALGVPNGNGTITGVVNIFNNNTQMFIRDTSDIQFTGTRCSVMPPTPISIADLRKLYTANMALNNVYSINGTVTSSSTDNKNLSAGSFVMQSGNRAILVYVASSSNTQTAIPYIKGDSVSIKAAFADSLLSYRNSLELKIHAGFAFPSVLASGKTVINEIKTIADINNTLSLPLGDPNNFEYALVKVNSATASSGSFSGSKNITDATGTTTLFTNTGAAFAGWPLPSNAPDWVLYGYNFNTTKEVSIRSLDDIIGAVYPNTVAGMDLGSTSPVLFNFDNIASGLPTGIYVATNARTDTSGRISSLTTAPTLWNNVSGAFKNFASGTGLIATSDAAAQNAATNRALGLRQTGTFAEFLTGANGGGGAFIFVINNTTGKSNLKLDFLLQSLDASSTGRTVTWTVDYGIGENPTTFTPIATTPAVLTTVLGRFASTSVQVNLPAALNNVADKVWIRIASLAESSVSGSRPSTAIDDFKISW